MTFPVAMKALDCACHGRCPCPKCGKGAYWWPAGQLHACVDPECAHQFREHDPAVYFNGRFTKRRNEPMEDSDRELHAMFMGFAISSMREEIHHVVSLAFDMMAGLQKDTLDDYDTAKANAKTHANAIALAASLIADAALHKLSHG